VASWQRFSQEASMQDCFGVRFLMRGQVPIVAIATRYQGKATLSSKTVHVLET
jgi:hypothetical protein